MKIGAENVYVVDLKREFVEELCFPGLFLSLLVPYGVGVGDADSSM